MPASHKVDTEILHEDHDALVTPSWLTVDGSSYAIRTIIKLEYRVYKPPTTLSTIVFFCALALIAICLWYLFRDVVPALLAWSLLLASTALMLFSAWFAFAAKPDYRVLVTFLHGEPLLFKRKSRVNAEGLHNALMKAMNWHVGGEILISADRHDGKTPSTESSLWQNPGGAKNPVSKANRKASQVLPFLAVLHQKIKLPPK